MDQLQEASSGMHVTSCNLYLCTYNDNTDRYAM